MEEELEDLENSNRDFNDKYQSTIDKVYIYIHTVVVIIYGVCYE